MRSPTDSLHGGRLHDDEPGAGEHEVADVNEVPRLCDAVDRAVLAHR